MEKATATFLILVGFLSWIKCETLGAHHMYDNEQNLYPVCPKSKDHTFLYFSAEDSGRDACGFPCVMHLSKGTTLAHAFDTHGHFDGILIDEFKCTRKIVGKSFSDWICHSSPKLPTALKLNYKVHCLHETQDGTLQDIDQYYSNRYQYSMELFGGEYTRSSLANLLNYFVVSIRSSAGPAISPWVQWDQNQNHDTIEDSKPRGRKLLETHSSYLSPGDINPAYLLLKDADGNPKSLLSKQLPATFCGLTYAVHTNHYFLTLMAISKAWVFFPIMTVIVAIILTIIHSTHQQTTQSKEGIRIYKKLGMRTSNPYNDPCLILTTIFRSTCVTIVFCSINLFIFFACHAVLDIYSYADMYTSFITVVVQYGVWFLSAIIYLWSLPSYNIVLYHIMPHGMKRVIQKVQTGVDFENPWDHDTRRDDPERFEEGGRHKNQVIPHVEPPELGPDPETFTGYNADEDTLSHDSTIKTVLETTVSAIVPTQDTTNKDD